jgi:phosphocarrier protein HPr
VASISWQGESSRAGGFVVQKLKIQLKSIDDVKSFVRIVNDFPYDVDLVSGRYVVDAKSIMGIFSLDLAQPIDVLVHHAACAELERQLSSFLI